MSLQPPSSAGSQRVMHNNAANLALFPRLTGVGLLTGDRYPIRTRLMSERF